MKKKKIRYAKLGIAFGARNRTSQTTKEIAVKHNNETRGVAIRLSGVKKMYKLGQIGGDDGMEKGC